jgi:Domain of unknown function DUF29
MEINMPNTNYETDFYAWANEQAKLLRSGNLAQADIENIAEEIESMGKTEKRELVSLLTILLLHLLKWQFQPEKRGASWEVSIKVKRFQTIDHIADNPSLKGQMPNYIASAYHVAKLEALHETGLNKKVFPETCPYTFEQMIDDDFWPN